MNDVHARAKQGIKILLGRQVAVQLLTFAGGVVLARILGPSQFGLYIISLFLVNTFSLLGDFGLSASFLQRKSELTDRDLQIGFTLQQVLTSLIVAALLIAAPWLVHLYPKAPPETVWLVRVLAFNLYLTSWRTMSALQLERHLQYHQLARIEVVESLSYQTIAVGLALLGGGVWSYIIATLVQGILGTVLVYRAAPWRIQFGFDKVIAREILRYGLPFQLQTIVNSLGGWVTPLLIGGLIGPQGVGYVTWASSNGRKPLILTDIVMRVAFPHFSRIQDDKEEVHRVLLRYLTLLLIPAGLWFSVLLTAGHPLVHWIYTVKWVPAVPALIIFAAALPLDMMSMMVAVTLNSVGQVQFTTRIVLLRSILNIASAIYLVHALGFIGVPVAYLASSVIVVPWFLLGLGRDKLGSTFGAIAWLLIPVGISVAGGKLVMVSSLSTAATAITTSTVAVIIYMLVCCMAGPRWLKQATASKLRHNLKVARVFPGKAVKIAE